LTNDEAATPASGQPLIVTGVSLLVGGTAATDGTTVTYTPDPGFGGQGSFVYSISGVGGEASATVVVNVGTPAAFLSLAPATLNFGTVTQLETSPPKVVTVSNTGNDTMTITSIVLGGAVDQYQAINSCPATLASGASCTVSVTFKPTSIGAKLATLDVNVGAPATSGSVSLSGIGLGTALTAAPGTLTFGPQTLNQSSPAQFVTLTNSGNLLAEFSATLSGPDASQFTPLSGGCPAMPPPSTNRFVAAGGSCTAGVTFRPTTTGSKNAKLLLTPTVGTLAPVTLTGTGAAASVTRTPSSLSFGNVQLGTASTPQAVTITNNGGAPVQLALSIASSQFSQTGTCPVAPAALASGANCVANVRFVPTGSTGTKNGTLTVTPIGNNSLQQTVGLSGTASSFSPPVITAPAPTGSGTPLSGSVPLSATLLGTNGVNRVQFLVAGTVVATDTDLTDGVTGVWNTRFQDNGTRIITARACGNSNCNGNNLLGTSAGVSVTVNNTLSLTAPASGPVSGPVSLAASLTATNGVNRVQFLVGNNVITFDGSPFPGNTATGVWNTTVANNGPRVIRARACGNNSCSTVLATSADVSVTVGN